MIGLVTRRCVWSRPRFLFRVTATDFLKTKKVGPCHPGRVGNRALSVRRCGPALVFYSESTVLTGLKLQVSGFLRMEHR